MMNSIVTASYHIDLISVLHFLLCSFLLLFGEHRYKGMIVVLAWLSNNMSINLQLLFCGGSLTKF